MSERRKLSNQPWVRRFRDRKLFGAGPMLAESERKWKAWEAEVEPACLAVFRAPSPQDTSPFQQQVKS